MASFKGIRALLGLAPQKVNFREMTVDTFFRRNIGGKSHPPGCYAAGQTKNGNDYTACIVKNWEGTGRNFAVLTCSIVPNGEVWFDLETHFRPWMTEQRIDWGTNVFPAQAVECYPDAAHDGNFIIIIDCDGGDTERHHKAVLITPWRV
jgi:hypothetical protein